MGKAIGGYVRRCERKPSGPSEPLLPVVQRPFPYPEPPMWQVMPILRFETFDVTDPVDSPGMDTIASSYGQRRK